jgi:hypothetical protein
MTRILIPTYPRDAHAMEVALALADRGHEAVLWNGSDFPTRQSASIDIQGGQVSWEISGPGLDAGRPPFDVVWFRRPTPAVLPPDMHPGDLPVAQRECRHLLRGLYQLVGPDAFWVNPLSSDPRAALKPPQLEAAVRAGLTVPRTLISNDPSRIRRFLAELRGRTVYKPFHASQWEDEGLMAVLLTNEVTVEDLPRDETLRLTPGIFQEKIDKAHELRVTVMGAHVVTARLLSQESEATRLDWRMPGVETRVEPDRLPREVERACRRLMRDLGIVFGCFDFIVTPEGEHVFLEVNPAGQFLWVEEAQPEVQLLAPFVDFLLARRRDFRWKPTADGPRHKDYYPAACARIAAESPEHVPPDDREYVSSDRPDGSLPPATLARIAPG